MKNTLLLSAALALVVLPMPEIVSAQGVEAPKANTRAARRAAEAKAKGATKAAPLFPSATREDPKPVGSPKLAKQLEALYKLQEVDGSEDERIAKADAILADQRANAFDKSTAGYIAGYAWLGKDTDNYDNAIKYIEGAIRDNGLTNNTHYQMMLQLAQMLANEERYPEATTYIDRYLAETKSEDVKAYGLKADLLGQGGKHDEAAAQLEGLLKKTPNDKKLLLKLANTYVQAGKDAEAGKVFDRMRAAGLLTESRDYEVAYRLLANIDGREKEALAMIDEGLEKGLLTPSYEMYAFQGQVYYSNDQIDQAIASWTKGAPLSQNGEMYLNLGKLQADEERWNEAKAAARSALDKGVKKSGDAWQVIGRAEAGLGNKAAAQAAYKEALKFPESKKWAEASLRAGQ